MTGAHSVSSVASGAPIRQVTVAMPVPQPTNTDIGTALRRLRKHRKLTIDELGHEASVHGTYVSLIERGQANPTWDVLCALTTALDTKPSKFLAWAEEAYGERVRLEAGEPTTDVT